MSRKTITLTALTLILLGIITALTLWTITRPTTEAAEVTAPTYTHQTITQPTPTENLDRNNPEAVAREVITLYTSRTAHTDTTYQDQIRPLITDNLAQEIGPHLPPFDPNTYPIAIQEVHLGDNIKEWGIDTPARYSHYATATINTATHGTYTLNYRTAAIKTPTGWTITDLTIDSWSLNHE
ncbi:hypothetical protein [Rothia nasimurium]|uniref:hypothetical protein n=1 Tax=Rothia nasimurium TaxID=85336 RepID=UPI001F489C41|nr:hypothetical protein [Rothia nasimurium]